MLQLKHEAEEDLRMSTLTLPTPATLPAGEIIAAGVSREEYLARYAGEFCEWVKGAVIRMSPESLTHARIIKYLEQLLDAYFALNPIGDVLTAPFVMRLDATESIREPDLQVVLHNNPGNLTETAMIGPADICIEVVSPESVARDYGDKFAEYERAGVQEYWIIDPKRHESSFYQRQPTGLYARIETSLSDSYQTPLLPQLSLHIPTLWQDELPRITEIVRAVQDMLGRR
jgi:Uma2 family endonuclease